jgi:hypothetical protein
VAVRITVIVLLYHLYFVLPYIRSAIVQMMVWGVLCREEEGALCTVIVSLSEATVTAHLQHQS